MRLISLARCALVLAAAAGAGAGAATTAGAAANSTGVCEAAVGPWSALLEQWATTTPVHSDRQGRIMALPPAQNYYVSDRVDRPPPPPAAGPVTYSSETAPHSGPLPGNGPVPYSEWTPAPPPPVNTQSHHQAPANVHQAPGIINQAPANVHEAPANVHLAPTNVHQAPVNMQYAPGNIAHVPDSMHHSHGSMQPANSAESQYGPGKSHQPGKILNKPPYKDQYKPGGYYPQPSPQQVPPHYQQYPPQQPPRPQVAQSPHRGPGLAADRIDEPPRKQVSETDLYLLSAIEKLVYRVDLMEKRLRKVEESLHYIVAGKDTKPEPCEHNFTRVGGTCYHLSPSASDWKSANLACRKLRAHLLELDSAGERRTMLAAMLADNKIRGMDVWTGGLNPGLLWIWSHSARPVVGNTTDTNVTIVGDGRCLALVNDPAINNYVYRGQDCSFRHRYICEKEEDKAKLSNEIERVARELRAGALALRTELPEKGNVVQ